MTVVIIVVTSVPPRFPSSTAVFPLYNIQLSPFSNHPSTTYSSHPSFSSPFLRAYSSTPASPVAAPLRCISRSSTVPASPRLPVRFRLLLLIHNHPTSLLSLRRLSPPPLFLFFPPARHCLGLFHPLLRRRLWKCVEYLLGRTCLYGCGLATWWLW